MSAMTMERELKRMVLPKTTLEVSQVCLGTMQFAGSVEQGTSDTTWGATDQATCDAGEEWVPRNKWMNRPAGASSESTDIRTVPYYAETQGRH